MDERIKMPMNAVLPIIIGVDLHPDPTLSGSWDQEQRLTNTDLEGFCRHQDLTATKTVSYPKGRCGTTLFGLREHDLR